MADKAASPNVADSTVNAITATAQANTSAKTTVGAISGAQSFNGSSDYLNAGQNSGFSILGNITLQAWIKVSPMPSPGNVAYILGKGYNGESESYFLRLDTENNGVSYVKAGTAGFPNVYAAQAAVSNFSGAWHYVVGTYDGNWNVYVDGVKTTSTQTQAPRLTSEPL